MAPFNMTQRYKILRPNSLFSQPGLPKIWKSPWTTSSVQPISLVSTAVLCTTTCLGSFINGLHDNEPEAKGSFHRYLTLRRFIACPMTLHGYLHLTGITVAESSRRCKSARAASVNGGTTFDQLFT